MSEKRPVFILLMEDEEAIASFLHEKLQRMGFYIDIASNGKEGLSMLDTKSYDVILIDYKMPLMNGLDVIKILSLRDIQIPVIMITGKGNEQIAVEAMKLGASDYLVKDIEMGFTELLPSVIERAIENQRLILEKKKSDAEKERLINELQEALLKVKKLSGLIPICVSCKKIRNDRGYWKQVEEYISEYSGAEFSHGFCPDCARELYPKYSKSEGNDINK